jgi:hypothetical protein
VLSSYRSRCTARTFFVRRYIKDAAINGGELEKSSQRESLRSHIRECTRHFYETCLCNRNMTCPVFMVQE